MGRRRSLRAGGLIAAALALAGCSETDAPEPGGSAAIAPEEPAAYAEFELGDEGPGAQDLRSFGRALPGQVAQVVTPDLFSFTLCVPELPFSLFAPPPWVGESGAMIVTGIDEESNLKTQLQGGGLESLLAVEVIDRDEAEAEARRLNSQLRRDPGFDTTDCPSQYGAEVIEDQFAVGSRGALDAATEAADGTSLAENDELHDFPRPGGDVFFGGFVYPPPAVESARAALPGQSGSEASGLLGLLSPEGSLGGGSALDRLVVGAGAALDEPIDFALGASGRGVFVDQRYELLEGTETGPPSKLLAEVPADSSVVLSYAGFGDSYLKDVARLVVGLTGQLGDGGVLGARNDVTEELGFDPISAADAVGDLAFFATRPGTAGAPGAQLTALLEVEDRSAVGEALEALRKVLARQAGVIVLPGEDESFTLLSLQAGLRFHFHLGEERLVVASFGAGDSNGDPEPESALEALVEGTQLEANFQDDGPQPPREGTQVTQFVDFAALGPIVEAFAPGEVPAGDLETLAAMREVSIGTRVEGNRSFNRFFLPLPAAQP